MNKVLGVVALCAISFAINGAVAADFGAGAVLPKGVRYMSFRLGQIDGFTDRFQESGDLKALDRYNIRMDVASLKKLSPKNLDLLESVFNKEALPNQTPLNNLDLGELVFEGESHANYIAPVFAVGLSKWWTVGLAVPIVTHNSSVRIIQTGTNNAKQIFSQLSKRNLELNPKLGEAEQDMAAGPAYLFRKESSKAGYKDVVPYEKKFVGDLILESRYLMSEDDRWSFYIINDLSLPTGPADDPDDLTDLPVFHKFYFDTQLVQNYEFQNNITLSGSIIYRMNFPDHIDKRVPETTDQKIIPKERTENVKRNLADEFIIQLSAYYDITDSLQIGSAYEAGSKGADHFSGVRGYDYSLLSLNTDSSWGTAKFKLSYSTVERFKSGRTKVPYEITYALSNMVFGQNIDRQRNHELIGKLYF